MRGIAVTITLALAACLGMTAAPAQGLSLVPGSIVLPTDGRQEFKVVGAEPLDCVWTVSGGEINPYGTYFAPSTGGTFEVQVRVRESGARAVATARVVEVPFGNVGGELETWEVGSREVLELPQQVDGLPDGLNPRIAWMIETPACGARLTKRGSLIAPPTGEVCVVAGRSEADPRKCRRIRLVVVEQDSALGVRFERPTEVVIDPGRISVRAGALTPLSAKVSNASSQAVRWRIEGSPEGASLDRYGMFIASRSGIYRIVATSLSDPASQGFAEITVDPAIQETKSVEGIPLAKAAPLYDYAGGYQVAQVGGWDGAAATDAVVLWDADAKDQLRLAAHMKVGRMLPLGISLGNGRILVCNGAAMVHGASVLLRSAEIIDLNTGESRLITPAQDRQEALAFAHCGGAVVALMDGRILVVGGDDGGERSSGAEIFDPVTETFSTASAEPFPSGLSVLRLEDGSVLIFGGRIPSGTAPGPRADILRFDPKSGAFARSGRMLLPRSGHAATQLVDGRILITGGRIREDGMGFLESTSRCEVYDPGTGKTSFVDDLSEPREGHAAALLPTGQVLCLGGEYWKDGRSLLCATIESFDPGSRTFSIFDHPRSGIVNPALFVLPDGRAFTGGIAAEFDPARHKLLRSPCQ